MQDGITLERDGKEITVVPVEPRPGGGARLDVETDDGRKWRLDVRRTGEVKNVITTWRDGELEDLDQPTWLDDVLVQVALAA